MEERKGLRGEKKRRNTVKKKQNERWRNSGKGRWKATDRQREIEIGKREGKMARRGRWGEGGDD